MGTTETPGPWCRQQGPEQLARAAGDHGPARPPLGSVYVRRRLAALGLEGLLFAVRTLSVTRLRLRLSAPSLAPKSEEFLSLSLPDFSVTLPKLPEDEKTSSAPLWGSTSSFISSFISSSMITFPVGQTADVYRKATLVGDKALPILRSAQARLLPTQVHVWAPAASGHR